MIFLFHDWPRILQYRVIPAKQLVPIASVDKFDICNGSVQRSDEFNDINTIVSVLPGVGSLARRPSSWSIRKVEFVLELH